MYVRLCVRLSIMYIHIIPLRNLRMIVSTYTKSNRRRLIFRLVLYRLLTNMISKLIIITMTRGISFKACVEVSYLIMDINDI